MLENRLSLIVALSTSLCLSLGCGGDAQDAPETGSLAQALTGNDFLVTEIAQNTNYGGSTADKIEVYCAAAAGCPSYRVCDPTSTGGTTCSSTQSALPSGGRAVISRGTSITTGSYEQVWIEDCSGTCTEISGSRVSGPFACADGQSVRRNDCASATFGSCSAPDLGSGVSCGGGGGGPQAFTYTLRFATNQHGVPSSGCTSTLCSELKALIDSATTSISFAIYGVRAQQAIIDALDAAEARGVTVRGIVDSENNNCGNQGLYPYPDTPVLISALSNGAVVCDNGTGYSYIMHNKFFVVDGTKVWTGSTNISDTETGGEFNADVVATITAPQLAAVYTTEFNEMYGGLRHNNKTDNTTHVFGPSSWTDGSTVVESYFAPTDDATTNAILRLINGATTSLDVAIFYLTDDAIGDALVAAKNRGVQVRVAIDATGASNTGSEKDKLCAAGIPLKVENWPGKQHSKWAVADGARVVFGSQNWTAAGNDDNDENTLYVENTAFATPFVNEFARQWTDLSAVANCVSTSAEGVDSPGSCSDGVDNDFDSYLDCNDFGCSADPTCAIAINECLPEPSSGSEWIELFNASASAVDVSGYFVDDVSGGSSPQVLPAGSVVPANGYLLVTLGSHILNNSGSDSCRFLAPNQSELDALAFSNAPAGQSWARNPNGTGVAFWDSTPTPGTSNP